MYYAIFKVKKAFLETQNFTFSSLTQIWHLLLKKEWRKKDLSIQYTLLRVGNV